MKEERFKARYPSTEMNDSIKFVTYYTRNSPFGGTTIEAIMDVDPGKQIVVSHNDFVKLYIYSKIDEN